MKLQSRITKLCSLSLLLSILLTPVSAQEGTRESAPERTNGGVRQLNAGARPAVVPEAVNSGQKPVLKGGVTYCVPSGTPFKLKLTQVPTNGLRLLDRDLDGKLIPAKLGDVISAKVTEDIYVDDKKVIPEGTVFHGKVAKIHDPRRFYRQGWLELSFDRLKTPDGKVFAFEAKADNFKNSTARSKLQGAGRIAAHAAGGAIVGALVAYQLFGMEHTIDSYGINIGAGAAGGAIIAGGYAAYEKGPKAVLEPGDDLNMQFDIDLIMPAAVEPVARRKNYTLQGLEISINKVKTRKDNLQGGGSMKCLTVSVDNNTDQTLNSIDCFLLDSEGNKHAICAGLDEDSEFIFHIEPHSLKEVKMTFRVEFAKLKYTLVWLDHRSRRVCYKQPLPL